MAEKTYDILDSVTEVNQILENKADVNREEVRKALKSQGFSVFYDIYTRTKEGKSQLVDLELQYFDESQSKVYVEIRKKVDKRMEMALYQINQSHRPEALLNFDKNLSIIHCNEAFHQAFESSETLRHTHFKNDLVNGFLPESREKLIRSIMEGLSDSPYYSTKLKVNTATGEERWYLAEMEKRTLDHTGEDKIFAYMTNIDRQMETEEQFALTNQYLSVLQKSTVDILYRVDVINNVMYHYSDFTEGVGVERGIHDYVNVFIREKTIHPEDLENYLSDFENFYLHDVEPQYSIRFSVDGQPYKWYKITAKKIFDKDGNLKEVFGALVNVEQEHKIHEKVSILNQYYETMRHLSDESLYVFDLNTRLLQIGGLTSTQLGLPDVLSGYPESIHYLIHPEDLSGFITFSQRSLGDSQDKLELRFLNIDGTYQWYELLSSVIFDEKNKPIEILGRIKNIETSKKMQADFTTLNHYFDSMQEFTSDILYRVDVETQTLYHAFQSKVSLRMGDVVPNYMETLVNQEIIHPEDAKMYVENTKAWMKDDSVRCEMRAALVSEEYRWYSIKRKKIYDKDGKLVEIFGAFVDIHKERELEEKFDESNQYFQVMKQLSDDIYYRVEVDTMTLHHNFDSEKPYVRDKIIPDYVNTFIREKIVHPDDAEQYLKDIASFHQGELVDIPARFCLFDDEYHWYKARGRKIYDKNGKVVEVWGRLINEQAEKKAKEELSEVNQQFSALQELSDDILFRIDIKENVFYHSNEETIHIGIMLKTENYVETFIANGNIHPDDVEHYRACNVKLKTGELNQYEMRAEVLKGVYHWFDVKSTLIYSQEGEPLKILGRMKNIQKEKELQERAYHDLMTGALNKVSFEEQAGGILRESCPKSKHALIFIDLDDFKGVNDTLGHSFGDALLTNVAKRLKGLVRGDDLVGRIGGDEFAVMLRNVDNEESVLLRTNRMLHALQQDISFENKVMNIKASVGLSIYPYHGSSYKELIGKADLAVYQSKREGKNKVSLYTPDLEE